MTLIGDQPTKVNMASLEDKGRNFTSQCIILTTNAPYVDFESIRDQEAFKRRRHVVVGMQFRRGYDANRMAQARHDEFPNWEHCCFALTHNITGNVERGNMTLPEVLEHIETRMQQHYDNEMARLATLSDDVLPRGITAVNPPEQQMRALEEAAADFDDDIDDHDLYDDAQDYIVANLEQGHVAFHRDPEENEEVAPAGGDIEDDEEEAIVEAWEEYCGYLFQRDESLELSPDEQWAADVFMAAAERMNPLELLRKWRRTKNVVRQAPSKLYNLAVGLFESLKQKVVNFWHENPKLCKILGVMTLLTSVSAVMFFRKQPESEVYESGPSRAPKVKVIQETYESGPARASTVKVIANGSDDPQSVEISNKIKNYTYPIQWVEGVRAARMNCIHVGGHLILAPYHFFNHAADGDWFEVNHRTKPCKIEFHSDKMIRLEDRDWVVYDCGIRLETGKQLAKFFVDENHLGKFKQAKCQLIIRDKETFEVERMSGNVRPIQQFSYKDPKFGDVYSQSGWEHDLNTESGHCGGPLMVVCPSVPSPGKILGIHVAGFRNKSRGFAVLITRQLLERALNLAEPQCSEAPVPECVKIGVFPQMRIIPEGDFTIVGQMPDKLSPAQPLKSTLVETPFAEDVKAKFGPSPRIPAKLKQFEHNGERISPLKKAIVKYGHSTVPYRRRDIKKVERYLIHYFKQKLTKHTGRRIFSRKEAVQGLPGVEFAERMNLKSSPGWPYQMENKAAGKWHLFDAEGNIVDQELERRLNERERAAKELKRVPSIWRDCLKDELRPTAKVEQGKTRLFTIAPVDFTILTRQMFFDFIMAFYGAQGDDFFSAVGINPESPDWTKLYNYLTSMNTNVVAGDYECFDGKEMPEIIMLVCDIINAWYDDGPENANIRKVLFEEIIHTMQLCENTVYMTHQGNPSGNPLTTIINTIVNLILMLLTWLEIFPQFSVEDFFRWVILVAYGDDNLIAIALHLLKFFNQNTIAQALAKHGIIYTSEAKTGDTVPDSRPISEVTFLKRGFRTDSEFGKMFVLPTMSLTTLNSYFYYYRQSPDPEEQIIENQRSALLFAAFHGRQFYDEYLSHWQAFMHSVGMKSLQISFEEQVDAFHFCAGMTDLNPRKTTRTGHGLMPEGMEKFMEITNSKPVRIVGGAIEAPFYAIASLLGLLSKGANPPTDDRWAIAIPSGEGKSTLARQYPHLFADHDELLLPEFTKNKCRLPWKSEVARKFDFPPEDRRVLLVHHPSNTNRRLVGSYITPFPTFIRTNCIQRLRLKNPTKMTIPERNILLVQLCSQLEPSLVEGKQNRSELTAYTHGDACLNQPVSLCTAENV
nr:MAG: RNA-dependent RNA polymerase [Riboviria sp.]